MNRFFSAQPLKRSVQNSIVLFLFIAYFILFLSSFSSAQSLKSLQTNNLTVFSFTGNNYVSYQLNEPLPLADFELDGIKCSTSSTEGWKHKLAIDYTPDSSFYPGDCPKGTTLEMLSVSAEIFLLTMTNVKKKLDERHDNKNQNKQRSEIGCYKTRIRILYYSGF